ncbi:MAG: TonB-dependent receptor plug domain-containing protein [Pseudomonadota bacterium]
MDVGKSCAAALWLAFVVWPAEAVAVQDLFSLSPEELSRLEVTVATGTPRPQAHAPAAITVISAAELLATGARTLDEALEAVPGLHVSRGSFQYAPRYFIRGIVSTYNPHTLVLVNGLPTTSLFLGDRGERLPSMYSLPVHAIERVEIVRGPGSAVYGADAFAGVINIITRGPDDMIDPDARGMFSAGYGSFDTRHARFLQSGKMGPVRALASLAWMHTDGDDEQVIAADAQTGVDALGFWPPASLAPGSAATSSSHYDARIDLAWGDFRLRSSWMRAWDTGTGQGINDALDPDARFLHHRGLVDLTWHDPAAGADWGLETRLSYQYGDFENPNYIHLFPPGAFGIPDGVIGRPNLYEENARAGVTALYSGWQEHRVRTGLGFFWGDIFKTADENNYLTGGPVPAPRPGGLTDVSDTPAVFQPENQRTSSYAFVQDEWTISPRWDLTTGVRFDHYSDVGGTTNPRLALVWQTAPTLTSKLMYGEAFRPPAFFELYATSNPVALGNPGLEPEKLRSVELALGWRPSSRWTSDLNLYAFRIRNFIDFVADAGGSTFTAQNTGSLRGRGAELEVRYQWSDSLKLLANGSVQRTEDRDSDHALGQAPTAEAYLRVIRDFPGRWQLTPQLTWVGERRRQPGDARGDLDGYLTFDVALRKRLPRDIELALGGRNLCDANVREPGRGPGPGQAGPAIPQDLPQAGRSLYLDATLYW